MSKFVHKVKDAMTGHEKEAPGAHGPPAQEDTWTAGSNPDQHNTSSMNPSSGMNSKDSYGSGPRSGNEPGTYRDSKFNGQSPSTFVLANFSALVYGLYADWKYRHPQRS
jgi:hypothetical protein